MVTENERRWPVGLHGTPGRFGKLVEYHLFDAPFFSVHGKQAQVRAQPISPCPQACMQNPQQWSTIWCSRFRVAALRLDALTMSCPCTH
jgi:hypothetical protein